MIIELRGNSEASDINDCSREVSKFVTVLMHELKDKAEVADGLINVRHLFENKVKSGIIISKEEVQQEVK